MYTTFRLKKTELNSDFLQVLKSMFKEGEIEINVSTADETEYLMKSEANKKRLLKSVKNINAKKI